jgi:Flp pilus assembly protein TadG
MRIGLSALSTLRLNEQSGQAIVELAFVLPLVLLLLIGMVDFGKAFNEWIDSTHLANEGVRLAAVNYNAPTCTGSNQTTCLAQYIQQNGDLKEITNGRSSDRYAPGQNAAQVCISFPAVSGHSTPLVGDPVQITVTTNYRWLNYLSSKLSFATTPIIGKATMRLEGVPTNFAAGCYP